MGKLKVQLLWLLLALALFLGWRFACAPKVSQTPAPMPIQTPVVESSVVPSVMPSGAPLPKGSSVPVSKQEDPTEVPHPMPPAVQSAPLALPVIAPLTPIQPEPPAMTGARERELAKLPRARSDQSSLIPFRSGPSAQREAAAARVAKPPENNSRYEQIRNGGRPLSPDELVRLRPSRSDRPGPGSQ